MRVAILGFGLIGGSIARALRKREADAWSIAAWSPSGDGPAAAADAGLIDTAAAEAGSATDGAGLVILAAPPLACLALLDRLADDLRSRLSDDAVVTDVASTKRRLVDHAAACGLRFVGGHPMAGREASGYDAADPDLFVGRPWVVCGDGPDAAATERVERLAVAAGGRPIRLTAEQHDAAVAAVSHLPLVVSVALVEAVARGEPRSRAMARDLAAGGWESMTRLARGDVEMAAGILATNSDNVLPRLQALRDAVDEWMSMLASQPPDADALRDRLAATRRVLDADGE